MNRNRNFKAASNVNRSMMKQIMPLVIPAKVLPPVRQRSQWLTGVVALLCTGALLSTSAQAQLVGNQLSGVSGSELNTSLTNPVDGAAIDSQRQILDLELAVEQLEVEEGAWGAGLSEQLSDLGRAYQLRGEHEQAIEVFERAIHVNRINRGLYDLNQVDIIEDMLDSLIVTRQWKDVHERQQYLFWLHSRNFGNDDPRMLPVIDRLGSWYINDYALNPENRVVHHLVDAYNLFDQATSIVETQYGENDLRLIMPLRGLVLSNWFLWTFASQNPGSVVSNERFSSEFSTANSFSGNPNRLAPYVRNNYANGKKALDRMVQIYEQNPEAPPGAAASAKIELADWHMLSRRWRSATELYQEAYNSLVNDEETRDQAFKLFERPVALPDLVLMESDVEQYNERTSTQIQQSYVLVSYDVTRFGEARNINILESFPEDNVGMRARVKRSLSNTRFRPKVVDGELVDSDGLIQKYLFN